MGMDRLKAFDALVEQASALLLRGENEGDGKAVDEALVLIGFLRRRFGSPFTPSEIALLGGGAEDDRKTVRAMLAALKAKHAAKTAEGGIAAAGPLEQAASDALAAAE